MKEYTCPCGYTMTALQFKNFHKDKCPECGLEAGTTATLADVTVFPDLGRIYES